MQRPLFALALVAGLASAACSDDAKPVTLSYEVPLQDGAYWPKFRRTADNRGYSPVRPGLGQTEVWSFDTGKGIFSSPVIDKDGTIYIGSANKNFYALQPDGQEKWKKTLGELVDSAALIAADGTVHVGSGDGHLYAFNPDGSEKWKFLPKGGAFITWFEGNVMMGPDGTLYAGNDDFHLYAIDPATGKEKWNLPVGDQIWSGAGFSSKHKKLYFGCNDLFMRAVDLEAAAANPQDVAGKAVRWKGITFGSVVSSPLVTDDLVVYGSFDGFIYGYEPRLGEQRFKIPTRGHVYASAARAADGTFYQPSADGTLYAFDATGKVLWTYDTLDAIRSSPAVGGDGTIYFGGSDGKLYAINPDGKKRWSFDASVDDRNDLNASPALGKDAIYIAGEDGKIWSVPYDYCLRQKGDARCDTKSDEGLAADSAQVFFLTRGGSLLEALPQPLTIGESVAVRLVVREKGATIWAAIDTDSLKIEVTPPLPHRAVVAANGSFVVLVPEGLLTAGTKYELKISGQYRKAGFRLGNNISPGAIGGTFDQTLGFETAEATTVALPLPTADKVAVYDIHRLAAPQPPLLPSYNQIGFDFMHLLMGIVDVDATSGRVLAWVSAALPSAADAEQIVVDPSDEQRILFPLEGKVEGGAFVFESSSFRVEFANVEVPLSVMRLGGPLPTAGKVAGMSLYAETVCGDVEFYGGLLRAAGLCNYKSDKLVINGAALLRPMKGGEKPAGLSAKNLQYVAAASGTEGSVSVELEGTLPLGKEHLIGLLLRDKATGKAYPLNYSQKTNNELDAAGKVIKASLTFDDTVAIDAAQAEVIVLHDLFPLARLPLTPAQP